MTLLKQPEEITASRRLTCPRTGISSSLFSFFDLFVGQSFPGCQGADPPDMAKFSFDVPPRAQTCGVVYLCPNVHCRQFLSGRGNTPALADWQT